MHGATVKIRLFTSSD